MSTAPELAAVLSAAETAFHDHARGRLADPGAEESPSDSTVAVTCTLGSKHLAVGVPRTVGVLAGGALAADLVAMHHAVFPNLEIVIADAGADRATVERAAACDVVCVGPGVALDPAWIPEGSHVNLAPGALAGSLLTRAVIVVDDPERAPAGATLHASLGQVIAGEKAGRRGAEITVLCVTGLAAIARVAASYQRD